MKFLKSTVAIVALLAIGSVSAKVITKKAQPAIQPVFSEQAISDYIDETFNENDEELRDMLITNYNDYEKKDICQFIQDLAGFIGDKFPLYKPTARKLFKQEMMGFCDSVKYDTARITFIQQCIDSSMVKPGTGTRQMRKTNRLSKQAK